MHQLPQDIETTFLAHANPEIAAGQQAYMKDQFAFYGIKTPQRRTLQKPFLAKAALPAKEEVPAIVRELWQKPQRECQYCAQELLAKYAKQWEPDNIDLFVYMITHKSWWDTVDFIATKLVGTYFMQYPAQREPYLDTWLASGNIWLQRTALLFQLHYKQELNQQLLTHTIRELLGSDEFFINKAIGWILREYSKTNPDWVRHFVEQTPLSPLSRREALRVLEK
ncbi:MAG TPA: DNA alkylation repair protein [Saprospiraceae bacterium]|nr:DNA alkylation repair protein [Saprospiraceae bacterium]